MKGDIIRILADWNIWWEKKEVPESLLGREREKSNELIDLLKLREIKIVTGVRRSGKSTLLYQVIDRLLEKGTAPKNILLLKHEEISGIRRIPGSFFHRRNLQAPSSEPVFRGYSL